MIGLNEALSQFANLFCSLGIDYAVMGGIAVRIYGIPRPTYDIDFTAAVLRERLPELFRQAEELGYTVPDVHSQGWVDHVAGMPVVKIRLYLAGNGLDVDIFLAESAYQRSLLARRRLERFDDLSIWIVTPEDLILLKLLAHRPRDMADIADVLFMQGPLDESYMRRWAAALGVLHSLEQVLSASGEQS